MAAGSHQGATTMARSCFTGKAMRPSAMPSINYIPSSRCLGRASRAKRGSAAVGAGPIRGMRLMRTSAQPIQPTHTSHLLRTEVAAYQRGALQKCQGLGEDGDDTTGDVLQLARRITASDLYSKYLQGAVFVFLLGLVDAAYSGDWSRIGAITVEQEEQLKQICISIGLFHCVCVPTAAVVAVRRGLNWAPLTLKVAAVGGLALFEVLLMEPNV